MVLIDTIVPIGTIASMLHNYGTKKLHYAILKFHNAI